MKRAPVLFVACVALVAFATVLSAAPASRPALPTSDAAFLASLATLAPAAPAVPGVGVPEPTPMACPPHFCADARQECMLDCAPCPGTAICIISICDFTCSCTQC